MDLTPDELAGVVDLFGALPPETLREGLAELAFKRGQPYEPDTFEGAVDAAIGTYHLVVVDGDEVDADAEQLLVVGPTSYPDLPEGASDLPHILDVPERAVDRGTAARAAADRFRTEAARAVDAGDTDRVATLLDVSYELEAWGGLDLSGVRDRLDDSFV